MADAPNPFEACVAQLAAGPNGAALGRPGAGVLIWDAAVERLLWASPAAAGLPPAYTDASGRLRIDARAHERLRALAAGLAPREGARLERLRLDPSRPWLPTTCACALGTLDDGTTVLVTAFVGPVPKGAEPPAASASPGTSDVTAAGAGDTPAQPLRPTSIRFIWRTDAQARFTDVSSGLAEAVGSAAHVIGRTWGELTGSVVEDPDGVIAGHFARGETWGARTVNWRLGNGARTVPVDIAGMPVLDGERKVTGFRGFGLVRLEAIADQGDEPEAPAPEDDNWFNHLRDRVAEALSGARSEGPSSPKPVEPPARERPAAPSLSNAERNAFREIARALGARIEGDPVPEEPAPSEPAGEAPEDVAPHVPAPALGRESEVLDRLPIGILIHQGETVLFANRFVLDLTGFSSAAAIAREGGLVRLFRGSPVLAGGGDDEAPLALTARSGDTIPVSARLSAVEWEGEAAQLMLLRRLTERDERHRQRESRIHELESILDTATDGVIVLDETGRILSLNRSAEALFGYDQKAVVGDAVTVLLAPESHMAALDYLEAMRSPGVASLLNDGREVLGRERQGGTIPLFMTMGCMEGGPSRRFCAVLRDITAFKKTEGELVGAKRAAETASAQKSDLLAKISHEIRTPLNAIIGFAEMMLEERLGPIGNERYKEYLKDVHASGAHVISLVNDLLDLAKVEAGRLELTFTSLNLNDLVSACVALLQPQAARERIVMRMSFAPKLPPVVADERSVRQIALNLLSNAIKFTDAGGQVIISTAVTDKGEVAFRVRDTGIGMSEDEVEAALEPFRQLATARRRGGTGLGLPLTKALVEANRGALQIASQPNEGTLVEVIFPPTRVLAE